MFASPEAQFSSHRSSILALSNKMQAVFIDEVHCVAKWSVRVFFYYNFHFRSSHFRTVCFTKRPVGGAGCQILRHAQFFFAPTICKLRWMVPVFRFFEYVTLKGKNKKSTQRHNKICVWLDCKTCSRPKMTIILSPTVTMATILDDCSDLLLSLSSYLEN